MVGFQGMRPGRLRRWRCWRAWPLALCAAALWLNTANSQSRDEKRVVIWSRASEAAAGLYRTITDGSGLVEVDSEVPPELDSNDLDAVCRAKDEAIRRATIRSQPGSRQAGLGDDPTSAEQVAMAEFRLGAIATYAGQMDDAVTHLQKARDALAPFVDDVPSVRRPFLTIVESLGAAHLRRGEITNCLTMPNAERCLFPVLTGGRHLQKEGVQAAAVEFERFLKMVPSDLEVRWLLNLSYMLSGGYPEDVPPDYLLGRDLFKSEAPLPRFVDVAQGAGFGRTDIAGGTIADDFDGDGLIDVFVSSVDHCAPARLYRNRGDGTFDDRTEAAGLSRELGAINAIQTDYNNDGRLDVFMMRGGWEFPIRNSLLRNNGDGTFTDVTRESGLVAGVHATHSVAWGDYDNDGWVDVFMGHEMSLSQLFRNRGDGTFEDVTAKSGIAVRLITKGVVFGDYDNDGFPDLYLSNVFGDNMLFHNNRNGTFTEVGKTLGVERPSISFPTWFFDYDNDGWLDIFVASYPNSVEEFLKHYLKLPTPAETLTLYRNRGDGTFQDVTRTTGLDRVVPAMGANFGDLDNDGFLDMYLGTGTPSFGALMPNIMLKNDAGRRFLDVTEATGTGHLQKGHGIAFVDIDNDGDEDVVLNNGGAVPGDSYGESLFENPGAGSGNHWLSLRLVGVKSNRAAIGAKIRVHLSGDSASKLRYREVTSGGSFGSNSLMQHIGLGTATVSSLEIEWPASGTKQIFRNVPVDAFLEIKELAETFTVRKPPSFTLKRTSPDAHQH